MVKIKEERGVSNLMHISTPLAEFAGDKGSESANTPPPRVLDLHSGFISSFGGSKRAAKAARSKIFSNSKEKGINLPPDLPDSKNGKAGQNTFNSKNSNSKGGNPRGPKGQRGGSGVSSR